MKSSFLIFIIAIFIYSCKDKSIPPLPYLGNPKMVEGKEIKHSIRKFAFLSQDSVVITDSMLKQQIHIADFFFTSCPSICPVVAKNMLKIHDAFKSNKNVRLVSFTLDPKRDTPARLRKYANNLEVKSDKWLFLTGDKDFTHELARSDYFVSAMEDAAVPGGFDHSGKILLVDKSGHIRAFCEGTDATAIPKFIDEINQLLSEYK